jgi:hypothetical protein
MHRCITPILCAVLLASVLGRADAASPGRITLHLSITGTVTQQITWSHAETLGLVTYGCDVVKESSGASLGVEYNSSRPGFDLTVFGYSRSQHQYNLDITGALVELVVRGKGYQPSRAGVADGTVEVQNGGRSGSFRIKHLIYILDLFSSHKRQVTVTGTWHCDTMLK